MDADRFARLAPRHRECLRLVSQLKSSKQIAVELGIAPGTVDRYLTEAAELLGVRGRAAAANLLAKHENPPHGNQGGESSGVVAPSPAPAIPIAPQPVAATTIPTPSGPSFRLPLRRKGEIGNDLTKSQRLMWIPLLATATVIGFGTLVTALDTLAGLLGRVWPLPQ